MHVRNAKQDSRLRLPCSPQCSLLGNTPPGTRTPDPLIKSQQTAEHNPCKQTTCENAENHSAPYSALSAQDDADLRAIAAAWPTLPAAVRAGIVAMVKASAAGDGAEAGK